MIKNILSVFALAVIIILCSCSSDTGTAPVVPIDTIAVNLSNSYFPLSKKYSWDYISTKVTPSVVIKDTVTGIDTISGKAYYTMDITGVNAKTYYRLDSTKLYMMGPNFHGVDSTKEFFLLDFNTAVGDSNMFYGYDKINNVEQKTNITTKARGVTYKTADGTEYSNVIKFTIAYSIKVSSTWYSNGGYDVYYAKGVGMVAEDYGVKGKIELKTYNFKK